jgi:hypothetical protein
MRFFRAVLPHYVCGFFVDEQGAITDSAPIMKWGDW